MMPSRIIACRGVADAVSRLTTTNATPSVSGLVATMLEGNPPIVYVPFVVTREVTSARKTELEATLQQELPPVPRAVPVTGVVFKVVVVPDPP